MPLEGTYEPSPWDQVAQQVAEYEATGGKEGGTMQGAPCVILWTRGRKSGSVRKSALIRVERSGEYAVIASMGGAPDNPSWFDNLVADPKVSLQDGPVLRDYTARVLEGSERDDWWGVANEVWPAYADYQTKTTRQIPVVYLEPRS